MRQLRDVLMVKIHHLRSQQEEERMSTKRMEMTEVMEVIMVKSAVKLSHHDSAKNDTQNSGFALTDVTNIAENFALLKDFTCVHQPQHTTIKF